MICVRLGEVFPAVAGVFLSVDNGSQMTLAIFVVVDEHSQKGAAFTNGFGSGCRQLVIQSAKIC